MFNISFLEFIRSFWDIIRSLWWLWLIVFGILLIPVSFGWLEGWIDKRRIQKWLEKHKTLEEWEKLSGGEFEGIVAVIFEKLGYKTKRTPQDGGVDIIAWKNRKRVLIQCKQMEKVIPDNVRAFWGSIETQIKKGEAEKGFFVTTGNFSKGIKEWVRGKPIELINGLKLEKLAQN